MKLNIIIFQLFATLFGLVKGIISLKLMTTLGHENYALLTQYMIFATFGVQIVVFSFDAPLVSSIVKKDNEKIARSSFMLMMLGNIGIVTVLSLIFSGVISLFIWGSEVYTNYVVFLSIYILALSLNHYSLIDFQGRKKFRAYGTMQITQQLLQLLAICLGVILKSVVILATSLVVAEFILWIALRLFQKNVLLTRIPLSDFKSWIYNSSKIAVPLFIGFLLIWFLTNGARLALVNLGGLTALAPFSATFSICILAGVAINPVCTVFFPYFTGVAGDQKNIKDALIFAQLALAFLTTLASIVIILTCRILLTSLVGKELYAGDFFVFCVCIAQFAYAQARIAMLYHSVSGRPKRGMLYFAIGVTVMAAVDWYVTREYSLNGVAAGYLIGCAIAAALFVRDTLSDNEELKVLSNNRKLIIYFIICSGMMMVCATMKVTFWIDAVFFVFASALLFFALSYYNFSDELFVIKFRDKAIFLLKKNYAKFYTKNNPKN